MKTGLISEEDLSKLLEELDPRNTTNQLQQEGSQRETPIILAVDDMPTVLHSVKTILKDKYKVIGVSSTNMAWDYLEIGHVDLVLLDIDMPDENGISFARGLKGRESTRSIPIVFLTGTATQKSVIEAFSVGGIDYIVKPVSDKILLEKIIKILG